MVKLPLNNLKKCYNNILNSHFLTSDLIKAVRGQKRHKGVDLLKKC